MLIVTSLATLLTAAPLITKDISGLCGSKVSLVAVLGLSSTVMLCAPLQTRGSKRALLSIFAPYMMGAELSKQSDVTPSGMMSLKFDNIDAVGQTKSSISTLTELRTSRNITSIPLGSTTIVLGSGSPGIGEGTRPQAKQSEANMFLYRRSCHFALWWS